MTDDKMREALEQIKEFGFGRGHGSGYSCAKIAEGVLRETPTRSLQQIKAEAVESSIKTVLRSFGNADLEEKDIISIANEYAEKIRGA